MTRSEPEPIVEMRPFQFAEKVWGGGKGRPPRVPMGMWMRPSAIGLSVMRFIDRRATSPKITSTEFVPTKIASGQGVSFVHALHLLPVGCQLERHGLRRQTVAVAGALSIRFRALGNGWGGGSPRGEALPRPAILE